MSRHHIPLLLTLCLTFCCADELASSLWPPGSTPGAAAPSTWDALAGSLASAPTIAAIAQDAAAAMNVTAAAPSGPYLAPAAGPPSESTQPSPDAAATPAPAPSSDDMQLQQQLFNQAGDGVAPDVPPPGTAPAASAASAAGPAMPDPPLPAAGDQGVNGSNTSYALPALGTTMTAGAGSQLSAAPGSSIGSAASAPSGFETPSNSSIDAAFLPGRLNNAEGGRGLSKGAIAGLSIFFLAAGSALIMLLVCIFAPCARKHSHSKAWQERRVGAETPYKKSVLSV